MKRGRNVAMTKSNYEQPLLPYLLSRLARSLTEGIQACVEVLSESNRLCKEYPRVKVTNLGHNRYRRYQGLYTKAVRGR
jgi:hypothetical protein